MNLSRKILLAACASVAFLLTAPACMVDEPDIEAKGTFVCTATPGCFDENNACIAKTGEEERCRACSISNSDSCLEGNVCVVVSPHLTEGRCVREEQVDHCHDYDNDGYMAATPGHEDECGFSEDFPMDCDDSDPNVYPGPNATEYCDGKDNTCDGCIDSICPKGLDCISDTSLCEPLVELCFGLGSVEDVANSVCSADKAGVRLCVDAKFVYAKKVDGQYVIEENGSCPTAEEINYVDGELLWNQENNGELCNGEDSDCNGVIDDGCDVACVVKEELCIIENNAVRTLDISSPLDVNEYFHSIRTVCNPPGMPEVINSEDELELWTSKCSCAGRMECRTAQGEPLCYRGNTELTKNSACAAVD